MPKISIVRKALMATVHDLIRGTYRKEILWSVFFGILAFLLLYVIVFAVFFRTDFFDLHWLDTLIDWVGSLAIVILTAFFFPATVTLMCSFFVDRVVEKTEKQYLLGRAKYSRSLFLDIRQSLKVFIPYIIVQVLILPLMFIPVLNLILFVMVSSFFMTQEFLAMIALRFYTEDQWRLQKTKYLKSAYLGAAIISMISWIPILNFILPLVAMSYMTHLFHNMEKLKN